MMIITFTTETGSVYQADTEAKRVRRINGSKAPTERFGENLTWRQYADISIIEEGREVLINWHRDPRPDAIRMKHNTLTSRVVAVQCSTQ